MKDLKRIRTNNYELERIQQNMIDYTSQFKKAVINDGILLKDLEINTTLTVSHLLNRNLIGYFVVKKNANADIWSSLSDDKILVLNSSSNVTINLWVF